MKPDNKYCKQCSYYDGNGNQLNFLKKYGYTGCSGISRADGEFPYDCKAHCFTDKEILTADEKRQVKKDKIIEMIKSLKAEEAAEEILKL